MITDAVLKKNTLIQIKMDLNLTISVLTSTWKGFCCGPTHFFCKVLSSGFTNHIGKCLFTVIPKQKYFGIHKSKINNRSC